MHMKMKDRLPAVAVRIDHNAIAVISETSISSDLGGSRKHMTQGFRMLGTGSRERIHMLAGYQKNMRRSLRAEIVKGDANVILIDQLCIDPPVGDLTEYTILNAHNER